MHRFFFSSILLLGLSAFTVFAYDNQSLEQQAPLAINSEEIAQQPIQVTSALDEYINRIAKKLITVSDQPQINFIFKVISSRTAGLAFDQEDNSILVSSALLAQIIDEAELAAVLSLGLAKYGNLPDPDKITINNLYRAGYDPQALIDLQEQYFLARPEQPMQWLSTLYTWPISNSAISYNKTLLKNMPIGLARDAESYREAIRSQ